MGTATILGTVYPTVVMPDGKEWMAENLKYDAFGVWFSGAGSDNGFGRYYLRSEVDTIAALLADGWHVPTLAEWQALISAAGAGAGNAFALTGALPNWKYSTGTNTAGFAALAAGYRQFGSWNGYASNPGAFANNPALLFWLSDMSGGDTRYGQVLESLVAPYAKGLGHGTLNTSGDKVLSMRLVRDYVAPEPLAAEAHETTHAMALEWTEAADGTPVAYDDGSAYDYIESTITARMTPAELTALETAWQSPTKLYTIYSTGYLLGPLIDMSAGVEVRLMSYQVDQSADSSMTLYDVTIGVHYGPLSAPSAGSLAVVQSRGRPYHSVAPGAASWITEGGTSDVNAYGRASERSCTWYTHSLTTAQAADVVNALRTLRGSSTTWTAGGVATPWGPSESGTATVWIPEWSVHRESNLLWGVQMELVRNG